MKKLALFLIACLLMSMTTGFMAFAAEEATDIVLRGCDFVESGGSAYAEGDNVALSASTDGYATYKVTLEEAGERYLYITAGLVRQAKLYVDVNGTNQIQADYRYTSAAGTQFEHFLGKISLNAGDNLIKVYIGVLESDEKAYIKSLRVAATPSTIKASGETEIPVSSFSKSENYGQNALHGYGGSVIYLDTTDLKSDYVEYTLYAEEAGRYYITTTSAALRNPDVTISVDGVAGSVKRHPYSTLYSAANLKNFCLGYADLKAGINTVKIAISASGTSNSTIGMTGNLTFAKDGHVLSTSEATVLSELQYTSSAATPAADSNGVPLNSSCTTVDYSVVCEADDVYTMTVAIGTNLNCTGYLIVNDETVSCTIPNSGSYSTAADMIVNISLKQGVNKISIVRQTGGFYISGITFERKAVKLSETETVTLDCGDYITASEAFNHKSFIKDEWATYRVHAPKAGLYYIDAYRGGLLGMLMDIEVNGTVQRKVVMKQTNTGEYTSTYGENKCSLGVIELNAGYNDIKIINTKQTFVMHKFDFTPVTGAGDRVLFGNEGIESPTLDAYNYPTIQAEQVAEFDVNMTENGDYALYVYAHGFLDRTFTLSVNGKTYGRYTVAREESSSTPEEYYVTTLSLPKGENKITITEVSSSFSLVAVYLRGTEITAPAVTFYAGSGDDLVQAESVVQGTMTAKIEYNNMFTGRDVFEVFAIYETDANGVVCLAKVMVGTAASVTAETQDTLVIENIELKEGYTYTAKVFTWHEMEGTCALLGE